MSRSENDTASSFAGDPSELSARMRAILEGAVDGIITIDRDGVIDMFNPAAERIFGYRAEEVIGQNVDVLMPSPYHEEHDGYLARYLETGEKHIIGIGREVTGRRRDGHTFPLDLAVAELELDGEPYFTGFVRDVSARHAARQERERLIKQLAEKNAELERFTYTVSHDLKSPLITIKGFLGMLEQDLAAGNEERVLDDMARIAGAADTMKELLDEVLELSRIGRVANPLEDVDLGDLVAESLDLLSGPIDAGGIDVEIVGELPVVWGDPVRLREVFQNLVENAIKFTADEPTPRIEIGADDDGVVHVADNGKGIDPRFLHKVFGLFEQLDPSQDGTGVGLALVYRIVEVHGGEIWAESDGLGQGTTFFVRLPRHPQE